MQGLWCCRKYGLLATTTESKVPEHQIWSFCCPRHGRPLLRALVCCKASRYGGRSGVRRREEYVTYRGGGGCTGVATATSEADTEMKVAGALNRQRPDR